MFTHPHLSSELVRERQRDMLAHAERNRLQKQSRTLPRASQQNSRAGRRLRSLLRPWRRGSARRAQPST
jgi:hypothetical protein